jgi:hypothetical protein
MNRSFLGTLLVVASAFVLGGLGCAGQGAPAASSADSPPPIARIHTTKCGSCHTPPEPKTRARAALDAAFARHRDQKRAILSPEQWDAMRDYLARPEAQPEPVSSKAP